MWQRIYTLLTDPQALMAGYKDSQRNLDQQNEEICEQIAVVDRHIDKQQQKLSQLLDLYLDGTFTKAVLDQKRGDLEEQLAALYDERQQLIDRIAHTTITDEHILSMAELTDEVRDELANADFSLKRQLVEQLQMWCSLAVEDGMKVVYVHWYTQMERLCTLSQAAHSRE